MNPFIVFLLQLIFKNSKNNWYFGMVIFFFFHLGNILEVNGSSWFLNFYLFHYLWMIERGTEPVGRCLVCVDSLLRCPLRTRARPEYSQGAVTQSQSPMWVTWILFSKHCWLPPRVCLNRKLESEVESGLEPRHSSMGCNYPKWNPNCCAQDYSYPALFWVRLKFRDFEELARAYKSADRQRRPRWLKSLDSPCCIISFCFVRLKTTMCDFCI